MARRYRDGHKVNNGSWGTADYRAFLSGGQTSTILHGLRAEKLRGQSSPQQPLLPLEASAARG
ncbi:hypothetical protein IscW_ISCW021889 [Ixodes scapularis]|uniref:Uncharacterized protein n=1 Tax=Ixodes scapularis TaxID=6945 RepID=B7QCM3_IXOSC|nr:hypothetical protein IscW_ISCW021889 [Ixodes scapularis]|eukprot:XP_002413287.1 hypothetical protein IscW_ISCW021889 [Ixodes scapularis]